MYKYLIVQNSPKQLLSDSLQYSAFWYHGQGALGLNWLAVHVAKRQLFYVMSKQTYSTMNSVYYVYYYSQKDTKNSAPLGKAMCYASV